jgi:hypothetical protein
MIDTSKFTSARYDSEYLLCSLHTIGIYVFTLVLNLHSRTSKGPSVGEFVDGLYNKYLTIIISKMRGGYNKLHAHFKY